MDRVTLFKYPTLKLEVACVHSKCCSLQYPSFAPFRHLATIVLALRKHQDQEGATQHDPGSVRCSEWQPVPIVEVHWCHRALALRQAKAR
jgi:hypothetical protein